MLVIGLGSASATIYTLSDSTQLGVPGSFSATFNNTSGYSTATLGFVLNGFSTLDAHFPSSHPNGDKWTDQFTLSFNGSTIGTGYFKLGGDGASSWTGTGTVDCTTCNKPQTNTGGQATFAGISLMGLQSGTNTVGFSYTTPGNSNQLGEGFANESWKISAASVTAVPEPETYAMMLAGLGMMGFIARRRRAAKA